MSGQYEDQMGLIKDVVIGILKLPYTIPRDLIVKVWKKLRGKK